MSAALYLISHYNFVECGPIVSKCYMEIAGYGICIVFTYDIPVIVSHDVIYDVFYNVVNFGPIKTKVGTVVHFYAPHRS